MIDALLMGLLNGGTGGGNGGAVVPTQSPITGVTQLVFVEQLPVRGPLPIQGHPVAPVASGAQGGIIGQKLSLLTV